MNLYQTQHPYYCGIDLHAKQMYACVVDQAGKKHLHRNFKTRQADKFFDEISAFGTNVVIGCESTFNWYWLADTCREKQIPFVLGHALYLKPFTAAKSRTTNSILRNLPCCCGAATSPLPTPTPKNCVPPAIYSAAAPTWSGSEPRRWLTSKSSTINTTSIPSRKSSPINPIVLASPTALSTPASKLPSNWISIY